MARCCLAQLHIRRVGVCTNMVACHCKQSCRYTFCNAILYRILTAVCAVYAIANIAFGIWALQHGVTLSTRSFMILSVATTVSVGLACSSVHAWCRCRVIAGPTCFNEKRANDCLPDDESIGEEAYVRRNRMLLLAGSSTRSGDTSSTGTTITSSESV